MLAKGDITVHACPLLLMAIALISTRDIGRDYNQRDLNISNCLSKILRSLFGRTNARLPLLMLWTAPPPGTRVSCAAEFGRDRCVADSGKPLVRKRSGNAGPKVLWKDRTKGNMVVPCWGSQSPPDGALLLARDGMTERCHDPTDEADRLPAGPELLELSGLLATSFVEAKLVLARIL